MTHAKSKTQYTYEITPNAGTPFNVTLPDGRDQWALSELIKAGTIGCTSTTHPGPRWSGYVHKLRHVYHVPIETKQEAHGGKFPGTHARYLLACGVELVCVDGGVVR